MGNTRKTRGLLERMARIERMERGKVCPMTGRAQYNHQTWQDGRNVVRYVPAYKAASLKEATEGYRLFMKLAEDYANEIIRRTRVESAQASKGKMRAIRKKERRKKPKGGLGR